MTTFTVLTANTEFRNAPEFKRYMREVDPDVALLQQVRNPDFYREIPGYELEGFPKLGEEARGVRALVSTDRRVLERKAIDELKSEWTGPKAGLPHGPRVTFMLELDPAWVIDVHLPTHNNRDAQEEYLDRLANVFERHPNKPVLAGGDWNMEAHELFDFTRRVGGDLVSLGKVDHVIGRGFGRHRRFDLRQPGYAHGWGYVRYQVGD